MASVEASVVINALTVAAGLALGIERTLEFLKHLMDSSTSSLSPGEHRARIDQAVDSIAQAEDAVANGVKVKARVTAVETKTTELPDLSAADSEASESHPPPKIPVIPMEPLSTVTTSKALFLQMAAAGLGIIFAWSFEVRLLSLLMSGNELTPTITPAFLLLDIIFSGLVIGGGSQPIHVLITFLTERKVRQDVVEAPKTEAGEEIKDLASVVSSGKLVEEKKEPNPLAWQSILYKGGVKPELLEDEHLRSGDPNLVVYHHTAMSSASAFQDIVDEFLINKRWLTGYHSIIMPDGTIKSICRWDRYGNHARGLNDRSLGIAFHGNFHTDPADAYSNADGRFGNQLPTEAQLHAGARLIALWVNLYDDIELDFKTSILPHKKAMPNHTVCPGSNFPYERFEQLVTQYYEAWDASETAQEKIEEFRIDTSYVYA